MKKKRILIAALALAAIAVAVVALILLLPKGDAPNNDTQIPLGSRALCTDGNWCMTEEWSVERAESGAETLRVSAAEDSTAWNTFFNLYEKWSVEADLRLAETHGASDCLRLVFGDVYNNICFVVSAEYNGAERVLLRADVLGENGWKNVLLGEDWISVEAAPIHLRVERKNGANKLDITLSQNGAVLSEATTKTINETIMDMIVRPGLSAYNAVGEFTEFAVVAARKAAVEVADLEGVFEAGENVPTDDWFLGKDTAHNLLDTGSAIIADGEKECYAWNLANTLGEEWTISSKVEFGRSYRDSVCARFMFGPKTGENADYAALVTVNYANSGVNLEVQNKESGAWVTTATSAGWLPVSGRSIRIEMVKYKDVNRIAVFLYEGTRLLMSTFTDEMTAQSMTKYKHFGVMSYSSQVRFSEITVTDTADESKMPPMTERVFPKISELTIGTATRTSDWSLSKHTTYFTENGKPAMVIDSKGEEFSYYTRHSINGSWSASAKIEFGTYYSDTAGIRVSFKNRNNDFAALLTVKYSPADGTLDTNLQAYDKAADDWTDVIKSGWTKGESSVILTVSGDGKSSFTVKLVGAVSGSVLYEKTVTLDASVVANMQGIGFGTLTAQSKYSEIAMNLTGGAIALSQDSDDASDKTMYALSEGTLCASELWSAESGVRFNTDGAVIVSSKSDLYTYRQNFSIDDAFSVSADVLFGSLDAKGLCTARLVLIDDFGGMTGLFTVKFSDNFEVLVEGQYNEKGAWTSCVSNNAWHSVQDNRVHLKLNKKAGSNQLVLSISDYSGKTVFYESCRFPEGVARKISGFGLGVDASTVKFSNIKATAESGSGKIEITDYGMLPIAEGTKGDKELWTTGDGITTYTDGSVLIGAQDDTTSYYIPAKIVNGFAAAVDVHFGSLDARGLSTARLVLTDSDNNKIGLITVKFSQNFEVMVEGEYSSGGAWSSCVKDTAWRAVKDNRIRVSVTREDDNNSLAVQIQDSTGKTVFKETCAMPQIVARKVYGFGVGVDNAAVKFSNMSFTATQGDPRPIQELIPIAETGTACSAPAEWTGGDGIRFYSDNSMILTKTDGEVFSDYTAKLTDAFTFTAGLQFGTLDAEGNSTARIGLKNSNGDLVGLFTVKFSKSFEVMVQGQYYSDGKWTDVISDTAWKPVSDNLLTVSFSRAKDAASYSLLLRDSSGNLICQLASAELPEAVNSKLTQLAVGCYRTELKLTAPTVSGAGSATEEETIVPGTQTVLADWTAGNGVAHYTDGSIIVAGAGDCFSYYTAKQMAGNYSFKTDIVFGTKAADGTATARVVLADEGKAPVGLFTLKYSEDKELRVEGQTYASGSWTTVATMEWQSISTNRVSFSLTRKVGENKWNVLVMKPDGTVLYSNTAALAEGVVGAAVNLGVGSFNSQVKFTNMTVSSDGSEPKLGYTVIEIGAPGDANGWSGDAGVSYYADGSIIADGNGDNYTAYTAQQLGERYTLSAEVIFGRKGSDGTATARIGVMDADRNIVGLFTLKNTNSGQIMVEGQYYLNGAWKTVASSGWRNVDTNHVKFTFSKSAGSNCWNFGVTKLSGDAIFSTTTAELPEELMALTNYFALGCYSSQVQFKNIVPDVN